MKRLVVWPDGWPCKLGDCRPGHFVFEDSLCLKDEYGFAGHSYCETGEIFWGGTDTEEARAQLIVQPVAAVWEEYET